MTQMVRMTGIVHLNVEAVLTSGTGAHGTAAGVLCSEGCWANSCCESLLSNFVYIHLAVF